MASRSFHDLFLRARDHFVGSSRWAYLAVLALTLAHAVVVTPFIADSRRSSETSLQRTRLAVVESSLGELRGALEAVRQETTSMVEPALERLIEDLESDLVRLDLTRRQIAARAATEAAATGGTGESSESGELPEAGTPPAPVVPEIDASVQPFMLDDPDRIADLRDARTADELMAALAPLVDELIARPRFFDLARDWKDEALPRLEARLDTAASALPRLRSRFPEARQQWEALAGSLTALSGAARELRFEPPPDPSWWGRSDGTAAGVVLGLTPEATAEIRRPRRLAELEAAADRSVESYSEIVGKVAQAKRDLGEPAAGAFDWLDVGAVAMFPLLIGLVLGGAMIWRSQRLRELGFATRLAIEHGSPPGLERWLWSQVQWSTPAGASAATAWRGCVIQTLLGYFVAMSWITLATVQLRQLDPTGRQRLMIFAVSGASVVLLTVAHRLLIAHRAIFAVDDVPVAAGYAEVENSGEPPPAEEAGGLEIAVARDAGDGEDGDDEFLEVRPLRR